ncbi:twin-arginine translocation signal domain-containing protein, partial [Pseudomonas aeruginosa]|uniref:twin-arginine translocation signal domain-containing protein n=1 Tax=Pseudomonas aeruginosa TaxID=287 RepID=UPI002B413262
MTDHVRTAPPSSRALSRRRFLAASSVVAAGIGAAPLLGSRVAIAAELKTVRFSEAVHNLG